MLSLHFAKYDVVFFIMKRRVFVFIVFLLGLVSLSAQEQTQEQVEGTKKKLRYSNITEFGVMSLSHQSFFD